MTQATERAMKAAVDMELHAACSTTTRAKGEALDKHFPAYDELLEALKRLSTFETMTREGWGFSHPEITARVDFARAAIAKAEGRT